MDGWWTVGSVECKGLKGENGVKKGRQKLFRLGRKKRSPNLQIKIFNKKNFSPSVPTFSGAFNGNHIIFFRPKPLARG
jgi:hypothetical protein